jgi:hypothetical protein
VRIEELADISLVDIIPHTEAAPGVQCFFIEKKAVAAPEVAGRTSRLCHDVKGPGLRGCCHYRFSAYLVERAAGIFSVSWIVKAHSGMVND